MRMPVLVVSAAERDHVLNCVRTTFCELDDMMVLNSDLSATDAAVGFNLLAPPAVAPDDRVCNGLDHVALG